MEIIIGTSNKGKIREVASVLMPLGYTLVPVSAPIKETGDTITENANIKAIEYSKLNPDKYVIAEDSGLVIPQLNNLPGPYSARFYTIKLDKNLNVIDIPDEEYTTDKTELDRLNNIRLVELIKNVDENNRGAYFEVCFSVALNGKILYTCEGKSYGYIIDEFRGSNGFGYDPIFVGTDTFGKTYAELDNTRKNLRSYRKRALEKLGLWIANNIKNE